jgi:hypothetical protein
MRYLELNLINPWACLLVLDAWLFMKKKYLNLPHILIVFRGVDPYM